MTERLPPTEDDALVTQARDTLLQYLDAHEATCADPDCQIAANVAAFIAHCVGVKSKAAVNRMLYLLERYNVECAHCTNRN